MCVPAKISIFEVRECGVKTLTGCSTFLQILDIHHKSAPIFGIFEIAPCIENMAIRAHFGQFGKNCPKCRQILKELEKRLFASL